MESNERLSDGIVGQPCLYARSGGEVRFQIGRGNSPGNDTSGVQGILKGSIFASSFCL